MTRVSTTNVRDLLMSGATPGLHTAVTQVVGLAELLELTVGGQPARVINVTRDMSDSLCCWWLSNDLQDMLESAAFASGLGEWPCLVCMDVADDVIMSGVCSRCGEGKRNSPTTGTVSGTPILYTVHFEAPKMTAAGVYTAHLRHTQTRRTMSFPVMYVNGLHPSQVRSRRGTSSSTRFRMRAKPGTPVANLDFIALVFVLFFC